MAKHFIQHAIKRKGRIINAAKRAGVSTHTEAERFAHSKDDPSKRSAGNLALRFEAGGDLHHGRAHAPRPKKRRS
jgi:hypothetical protein